jgi:hypothetical protein
MEQSQQFVMNAYDKEGTDAKWSVQASHDLLALVSKSLPASGSLRAIACRATMCRLDVTLPANNDRAVFDMVAFRGWPGSVFTAHEERERDNLQLTYIASREGTELPFTGP